MEAEATSSPWVPRDSLAVTAGMEADVQRAAEGDRLAFERLYRLHVARIHTLARRFLGEAHADEETQEIFFRAWIHLPSFRGGSGFGTWLHRLAVNWLASRYRSLRRREPELSSELPEVPAIDSLPVEALDFTSAVERLPTRAKQVFLLHDAEGYGHEEIAELLEISAGTSRSQLSRARMLLRAALNG